MDRIKYWVCCELVLFEDINEERGRNHPQCAPGHMCFCNFIYQASHPDTEERIRWLLKRLIFPTGKQESDSAIALEHGNDNNSLILK